MAMPDARSLVRALLIAGFVAALVTSAFHLVVSERYVDRAIALEEEAQRRELEATGTTAERPETALSRRVQRSGLLVGVLVYGIAAGAVFAGVYALTSPRLPGRTRRRQIAALAGATVLAAVVVPFLKYPPNPPGVGDPGTLARRQLLYVGCLLLAVAGLWLAARLAGRLRSSTGRVTALGAGVAFYAVWVAALLVLLPGRTDPVHMPDGLLWQFRTAALVGQVLFWLVFGGLFAVLLERSDAAAAVAAPR